MIVCSLSFSCEQVFSSHQSSRREEYHSGQELQPAKRVQHSQFTLGSETESYQRKSETPKRISGKVIPVSDGDTFVVLVDKTSIRVRFEGIDAPERGQDHSAKTTQLLRELIHGENVEIEVAGEDIYESTLETIKLSSRNVNEKLVQQGWAWHYKNYSDDRNLASSEQEARKKMREFWAHEHAIPPWEFRSLERTRRELLRQQRSGNNPALKQLFSNHTKQPSRPRTHDSPREFIG